jgi:hypothetical protein
VIRALLMTYSVELKPGGKNFEFDFDVQNVRLDEWSQKHPFLSQRQQRKYSIVV